MAQYHLDPNTRKTLVFFFFPQRFEKVLWSVLSFLPLPQSSRSSSSWCAIQEITFWGVCFSRRPMTLVLFSDVFRPL